jgi:hypothetical protein
LPPLPVSTCCFAAAPNNLSAAHIKPNIIKLRIINKAARNKKAEKIPRP